MNLLTIFVFVLIIVLIYVVYKSMTKTTVPVSAFSDASKSVTLAADSSSNTANNYGYSAWLYIDAWVSSSDPSTPTMKNVVTRCDAANNPLFSMYLDNQQNNLNVVVGANDPCTIRNVQLQKWINLTMSVYGNTLDLYLDGKLVRTCIMKTMPPALKSSESVYVGGSYAPSITPIVAPITTNDGDLQGYISNVVFKADYFTPEEAWSIYSAGYSGAGMFNFLTSYKLIFSLTKNNQTMGQFSI
jgi:Concanavalin A-like lectin/glucanases superfamily